MKISKNKNRHAVLLFSAAFFLFSQAQGAWSADKKAEAKPAPLFTSPSSTKSVNLTENAIKRNAVFYWDSLTATGLIEKNGHQISFRCGEQLALIDYQDLVILDFAPNIDQKGNVLVPETFWNKINTVFDVPAPDPGMFYRIGAILIDPGHGGKDPGAVGTHKIKNKSVTVQEKDIVLTVSLALGDLLRTAYPDKTVKLTRTTDKSLSLEQRVEVANSLNLKEHEAVIYVSVHANSSQRESASGFEVWYLSPGYRRKVLSASEFDDQDVYSITNAMIEEEFTIESTLMAKAIMEGLQTQVGTETISRGIKAEEWFVVRNVKMPSVLVELGFVTNAKEAELFTDPKYLRKLSIGIYNGVRSFIESFEKSKGFTESN